MSRHIQIFKKILWNRLFLSITAFFLIIFALYTLKSISMGASSGLFHGFYDFIKKLITFNFGYPPNSLKYTINEIILSRAWVTAKFVIAAIAIAFVLAVSLAGWKLYFEERFRIYKFNLNHIFYLIITSVSFIPVFWVASVLIGCKSIFGQEHENAVLMVIGILILSIGDGSLAYLTDGIKQKLSDLKDKGFIQYANIRGLGLFETIFKHFLPHIVMQILVLLKCRLIFFISSAAVVEMLYDILGLGDLFISKGWGSEDIVTPLAILFYLWIFITIYNLLVSTFVEKEFRFRILVGSYMNVFSRIRDYLSPLEIIIKKNWRITLKISSYILAIFLLFNGLYWASRIVSSSVKTDADQNSGMIVKESIQAVEVESEELLNDLEHFDDEGTVNLFSKNEIRYSKTKPNVWMGLLATLFVAGISLFVIYTLGYFLGLRLGYRSSKWNLFVDSFYLTPLDLMPRLLLLILIQISLMQTTFYQSELISPWFKLAILALLIGVFNSSELIKLLQQRIHTIKNEEFFILAKSNELSKKELFRKYIKPNCRQELIQGLIYQGLISAIFLESTLSFLTWGSPEKAPTLGRIIWDISPIFKGISKEIFLPGILLFAVIFFIRLIGEYFSRKYQPGTGKCAYE